MLSLKLFSKRQLKSMVNFIHTSSVKLFFQACTMEQTLKDMDQRYKAAVVLVIRLMVPPPKHHICSQKTW